MPFQLTVTYSDYNKETVFFIENDCQFLGVDIKIKNDSSAKIIFPDDYRRINHNLDDPDNTINLDFNNFLAFLLAKKKIPFDNKTVEAIIFSYLLPGEEQIVSKSRRLPI